MGFWPQIPLAPSAPDFGFCLPNSAGVWRPGRVTSRESCEPGAWCGCRPSPRGANSPVSENRSCTRFSHFLVVCSRELVRPRPPAVAHGTLPLHVCCDFQRLRSLNAIYYLHNIVPFNLPLFSVSTKCGGKRYGIYSFCAKAPSACVRPRPHCTIGSVVTHHCGSCHSVLRSSLCSENTSPVLQKWN